MEDVEAPVTEAVSEMTGLISRWVELTLRRFQLDVRSSLAEGLTAVGGMILGGSLVAAGVCLLDILLYRWLRMALESGNWALFALGSVHVAVGGWIIRTVLMNLRGDS